MRTLVQDMEERIGAMIVKELLKSGYYVGVENEDGEELTGARNYKKILSKMFLYNNWEILNVYRATDKAPHGWVKLVYGNDGYDVLSDYTVNLESVLQPIAEFTKDYY